MSVRAAVVLLAAALLSACTASNSAAGTAGPTASLAPATSSARQGVPAAPTSAAPTRAATARSCPLAGQDFVRNTMGMRLGRIVVLRSAGRLAGCRFYALQGSPLHTSENLPGPDQPVVEITTARFAGAVAAHNAFVLLARKGRNAQRVTLGRTVGVCFQTNFYPKDHGADWACAASVRDTEVVVRTVDTTGTFSTATLTEGVLRRV